MGNRWESDEENERSVKRRRKVPAADSDAVEIGSVDSGDGVEAMRISALFNGCRDLDEHYEKLNKISEGSFGYVFRGRCKKTNRIVALKGIKIPEILKPEGFPIAALREISSLLELQHPNVIKVFEICVDSQRRVYMVMEYVEHELKVLLVNRRPDFSLSEKKRLMVELLKGVEYMHKEGYVHRDLKTANLLYANDGLVKICDFGLAKKLITDLHTAKIATLWYRAPECIVGEKSYGPPVDVWAVGCIFGEILTGTPLFPAQSEMEALTTICQLTGTPNVDIWPLFAKYPHIVFPKCHPSWRTRFPVAARTFVSGWVTESGLNLLKGLLAWDPAQRLTATQALGHSFFEESPVPQRVSFMPTAPETNLSVHRRRDSSEEENGDGRKKVRQRVNVSRYLEGLNKARPR